MRKFFASAFGLSATAALVLGAAFAWSANTSGSFPAAMGTASIAFHNYASTGNVLYDGAGLTAVETGDFMNTTPLNPGLQLKLTGGSIGTISASGCEAYMAGGDVVITDGSLVLPGGNWGGGWQARLIIAGSPDTCQGVPVSYTVNLIAGP